MSTILLNGITLEQLAEALIPLLRLQSNPQPENELLTRAEVCKFLSIDRTTLWKYTKSGKFKSFGFGNRVYYKKCHILEALTPLNAD